MSFCRTDTFPTCQIVERSTKFRKNWSYLACTLSPTFNKFSNKFGLYPDPAQLGCSFLVTNIPLGAYLLRLGAHYEPS
jgi:hypothetical protein